MQKKEHLHVVVETVIEAMVPMIIQIARRIVTHVLRAVDDGRCRHGGDQETEGCANEALTLAEKAVTSPGAQQEMASCMRKSWEWKVA